MDVDSFAFPCPMIPQRFTATTIFHGSSHPALSHEQLHFAKDAASGLVHMRLYDVVEKAKLSTQTVFRKSQEVIKIIAKKRDRVVSLLAAKEQTAIE